MPSRKRTNAGTGRKLAPPAAAAAQCDGAPPSPLPPPPSTPKEQAGGGGDGARDQATPAGPRPIDPAALFEEGKELIQRLECAFFTGADLTAILRLQELAVYATTALHDCWQKHETVPHQKWIHEVNGRAFLPRDTRREIMQLSCANTPFPMLHFWPQDKDNFTVQRNIESQSEMLVGIARSQLRIPGKKDNVVAPLLDEILHDFDQLIIDPFIQAWSGPAESLHRRVWELRARGLPKTREDVTAWARTAADWLVDKAKLYDALHAHGTLPEAVINPAKNCGRLMPDGDLYRIANPSVIAEKERKDRERNLPDHEECLKPQGDISDHWRAERLSKKKAAAKAVKLTEAHIGAGLQSAFVRYLKPKVKPKEPAPPTKV